MRRRALLLLVGILIGSGWVAAEEPTTIHVVFDLQGFENGGRQKLTQPPQAYEEFQGQIVLTLGRQLPVQSKY